MRDTGRGSSIEEGAGDDSSTPEISSRESSREEDRALLAARDVTRMLTTHVKSLRLFGHQHARTTERRGETISRFRAFFSLGQRLTLDLQPRAVIFGETPLIQVEKPHDSLFFPLVQSGVSQVHFYDGLEPEELDVFAHALATGGMSSVEDSAATTIIEADLSHIDLVLFDPYAEDAQTGKRGPTARSTKDDQRGEEFHDLLAEALREQLGKDEGDKSAPLTTYGVHEMGLMAGRRAVELANLAVPEGELERADVTLEGGEVEALRAGLDASPADVAERFVEAVLTSVQGDVAAEERAAARDSLLTVVLEHLARFEVDLAIALCRRIAETMSRPPAQDWAPPEQFGAFVRALIGLLRSEQLPPRFRDLWGLLPDAMQQHAIESLVQSRDRGTIRRLASGATSAGAQTGAYLRDQLRFAEAEVVSLLLPLVVRTMGDEAPAALRAALEHPDLRVRNEALMLLARFDPEEALRRCSGLLVDSDPAARKLARTVIEEAQDRRSLPDLEAALTDARLQDLDVAEKRSLFVLIGRLDRSRGLALARRYAAEHRWLQGVARRELRQAAISAIGVLGDVEAKPHLTQIAALWYTPKSIKSACAAALKAIEAKQTAPSEAKESTGWEQAAVQAILHGKSESDR